MTSATTLAVLVVLLGTMVLALVRATRGPGLYNRVLAINVFGTKTILLVAVFGFVFDRPGSLDIAILYALVSFVAVVAVLRLTHAEDLVGGTETPESRGEDSA